MREQGRVGPEPSDIRVPSNEELAVAELEGQKMLSAMAEQRLGKILREDREMQTTIVH